MPPISEARKRANAKYNAKAYTKLMVRIRKEDEEEIRAAIEASGESVNGYILKAIRQRMERERKE